MLEQIALSISTAIFFLCTVLVSSILPGTTSNTDLTVEPAVKASAEVNEPCVISLVGKWSGEGNLFEFTDTGKLIYNGITASYSFDGKKLTVTANIEGISRQYSVDVEAVDGRNIIIGGVVLHRTEN